MAEDQTKSRESIDLNRVLGFEESDDDVSSGPKNDPKEASDAAKEKVEFHSDAHECDENGEDGVSGEKDAHDEVFDKLTVPEWEEMLAVGSTLSTNLVHIFGYCLTYSHKKGFSVRRGDEKRFGQRGDIRLKQFLCSSSGLTDMKRQKTSSGVYKKMVTRTNCAAQLVVSRKDEGPFVVSIFETVHNHELIATDMSYMLRSNRNLNIGHQSVLQAMKDAGIGVSVACKFMKKESGGVPNVGFTRKDAYNHIDRVKRLSKLANEDASDVVKYFASKSNAEPFFFWKHECDEDGRLMNFFFRDSRSALDYESFGDVLSLDTTYRTNRYNLICAPFVGINHHSQNVMFGMAFLSDETTDTLKWLLQTFLESMHGKEPGLIYTDQALALMKAIDETFTSAKHRLCQWHISQNAPGHFGNLNGNKEFKELWYKCMNGVALRRSGRRHGAT
ncbi:protein FAR1-RELATED SEQUENCE 5-like [Salvia miltiorrhiza]|uniref:protein FAR1-RELATED SEQUENCE 5-like n=1 Tax=Salvia miltiorrhiza TaxID=226208 RepID=UPI0025ACE20A|nr:protein FAR1-RELATED SEQUENCE 5-like [Salvia miltiorrhiza]